MCKTWKQKVLSAQNFKIEFLIPHHGKEFSNNFGTKHAYKYRTESKLRCLKIACWKRTFEKNPFEIQIHHALGIKLSGWLMDLSFGTVCKLISIKIISNHRLFFSNKRKITNGRDYPHPVTYFQKLSTLLKYDIEPEPMDFLSALKFWLILGLILKRSFGHMSSIEYMVKILVESFVIDQRKAKQSLGML